MGWFTGMSEAGGFNWKSQLIFCAPEWEDGWRLFTKIGNRRAGGRGNEELIVLFYRPEQTSGNIW